MDGSAFTRDKHWGSVAAAAVILLGLVGAVAAAAAWARQPATAEAVRPLYRLHVIPHSDDAFHQEAKPVAQKALLDYLTRHGPGDLGADPAATEIWMHRHRDDLAAAVKSALRAAGREELVRVEVGPAWFDQRTLGRHVIPAGIYPATRVILGDGAGGNWWCALFQGLCVAGTWEDDETLQRAVAALAAGGHEPLVEEVPVTYRWFIRDWWQEHRASTAPLAGLWRLWLQVAIGAPPESVPALQPPPAP
ncbi:MAG TPA: stage II sporulation protein R [Sphingobacteriaceae bacterium]|nr:stage II sporulation protein R [Sphingobacteriaceae bacterium]